MKKSRREFVSGAAALIPASVLLSANGRFRNAFGETISSDRWRARVAIQRSSSYARLTDNPAPLLDSAMRNLIETERSKDSWRRLFRPDDVVAIKVNALAGPELAPSYTLVQSIIDGLAKAGIPGTNIIVWDRTSRELRKAKYPVTTKGDGVRIFGTDTLSNGYEDVISQAYTVGSCFSRILSRYCTAVINVGVLKDHDIAGISVLMKNYYGAIHNPNKYHENNCSPYIAHLNTHPFIRKKNRLNVVDARIAQYHGGPARNSRYSWPFNGILLSTDAVAADSAAREIIESKRKEAGRGTLLSEKREPVYLAVAGELGLGEHRLPHIHILENRT